MQNPLWQIYFAKWGKYNQNTQVYCSLLNLKLRETKKPHKKTLLLCDNSVFPKIQNTKFYIRQTCLYFNYILQTKLRENKILAQIPTNNQGIKNFKNELNLLRSFVISIIGEDKEGNYNPHFITEILEATNEKPANIFRDSKSFLRELNPQTIQIILVKHRKEVYL